MKYRNDDRFMWQNIAVYRSQYCILMKVNILTCIKDKVPCYIFSLLCVSDMLRMKYLLQIVPTIFFGFCISTAIYIISSCQSITSENTDTSPAVEISKCGQNAQGKKVICSTLTRHRMG
jgi:hypothetical protein